MKTFYLGTHHPHWLWAHRVPLFVSIKALRRVKNYRRARSFWACDSGGFTELQNHGHFTVSPEEYAAECRRVVVEIGMVDFLCIQDWMCEPAVINGGTMGPLKFVGTGLSVDRHQHNTVNSFLRLRELEPTLPWLPILQGYSLDDYYRCMRMYEAEGVDLTSAWRVGLGSICRRQHTQEIEGVIAEVTSWEISPHGFGVKTEALQSASVVANLKSADSLAWSFAARKSPPLPGHPHKSCSNCSVWAFQWREKINSLIKQAALNPVQMSLSFTQ